MSGKARLQIFLILAHLCLAPLLRAQDSAGTAAAPAPAQTAEPAGPAATEPVVEPAFRYDQTLQQTAYGEPPFRIGDVDNTNGLAAPVNNASGPQSIFQPTNPLNSGFDPVTGEPGSPFGTNLNPWEATGLGANYNQFPKAGQAQGDISVTLGSPSGIPFIYRAFPPDDAALKAGPFYLKFEYLQAAMLYSDNYRLSETDRQSEVLAILTLNMTLIAQLTEDLQLAINASLFYLPLQNIVGLEFTSIYGNLLLPLPALLSQITYDTIIAGWDVRFADQFQAGPGYFADNTRYAYSLFQGSDLEQYGNGQYTFHSAHVDIRGESFDGNNQNDTFYVYSNTISASTGRYFPGDILLTSRAFRTDLWYNQDNLGLPTSVNDFYIRAESVRENMRFKPFVSYEITNTDDSDNVYQQFYAGLSGPITDQLFLYSAIGYFLSNNGNEDVLWNLTLDHQAGPYTSEWLQVARALDDFDDQVTTTEYYRLSQVLGPTLSGIVFADHSQFRELNNNATTNFDQEDAGLQLNWYLGPNTTLTLQGIYTHQNFDDGVSTDTYTGRVDLWRRITDSFFFEGVYQYQRYNQNVQGRGYYENLIYLTLTKYFY